MENNNENQPLKDGDDNNKNKKNKQKVITIVVGTSGNTDVSYHVQLGCTEYLTKGDKVQQVPVHA